MLTQSIMATAARKGEDGRESQGLFRVQVLSPAFYRSLKGTHRVTDFQNMSPDFPNYSSVLVPFYAFLCSEVTVVYNLHMAVTCTWHQCHVMYLLLAFIFLVFLHTLTNYKYNIPTVYFSFLHFPRVNK